jgi:hypothetical protein
MSRGGGSVGLDHWRGRWARRAAEAWIGQMVGRVRDGSLRVGEESPLARLRRTARTTGCWRHTS